MKRVKLFDVKDVRKSINLNKILTGLLLTVFLLTGIQAYDLDIGDDLGNLVGNVLTMKLATDPYINNYGTGQFWLVNPDGTNNVDPDPIGNSDLTDIYYILQDLVHTNGYDYIPKENITINLSPIPYTLVWGDGRLVDITVTIPTNQQPQGTYESWVVFIDSTAMVADSFKLRVKIGRQEDIDIEEDYIATTAGIGDTLVLIGTIHVMNQDSTQWPGTDPDGPSNTDLYGIGFAAQNFTNDLNRNIFISGNNVFVELPGVFGPTPVQQAVIDRMYLGQVVNINVYVAIPRGTLAGNYTGGLTVRQLDGWPSDNVGLLLTILPTYDLDISDNTGNLVGNWMNLCLTPELDIPKSVSGHFILINPNSPALNVDPDPFGNTNLYNIIPIIDDLVQAVPPGNPFAYIPKDSVQLSITTPYTLLSGASAQVGLTVTVFPSQMEGEYTGWVRLIDTVANVADSFQLKVVVGPQEDVDVYPESLVTFVNCGDTLVWVGQFQVFNQSIEQWPGTDPDGPSNTDLYNLRFGATHLWNQTPGSHYYIPSERIYLGVRDQSYVPAPVHLASIVQLALGDSAAVDIYVQLPYGTRAGKYTGKIWVQDDDGWPSENIGLNITIEPSYDLDISDNTGNLVGNWMNLCLTPELDIPKSVSGHFILINPNSPALNVDPDPFGNTDLYNIIYSIDDLEQAVPPGNPFAYIPKDSVQLSITTPYTLLSGGSAQVGLSVTVFPAQMEGEYTGWVRLIDTVANVADSFQLKVVVGPQEDVDVYPESLVTSVNCGDSLVWVGQFKVFNQSFEQWPGQDPDGPSNTDLYNLRFGATHLWDENPGSHYYIPSERIYLGVRDQSYVPAPVHLASIVQLALGDSAPVDIYVQLPYGTRAGKYTGKIWVQDDDGWPSENIGLNITVESDYDLDIADNEQNLVANTMILSDAVNAGRFRLINPNTPALNVDPDMYGNDSLTGLVYSVSTLYAGAYTIPSSAVTFPGAPTKLYSGQSVDQLLTLTVPVGQHAGIYYGKVWVSSDQGVSDTFGLVVLIGSQPYFSAVGPLSDTVYHGQMAECRIMIINTGNSVLHNFYFEATNLADGLGHYILADPNINYIPTNIDSLNVNDTAYVTVQVWVPLGTYTGSYTGTITIKANDGLVQQKLPIEVFILPSFDLDIADNQANLIGNKLTLAGSMGENTQTGYVRLVNPNTPELNLDPDQFGNADFDSIIYTITDLTYVPVPGEKISYTIPFSQVTITKPGFLGSGDWFDAEVFVAIPKDQFAGVYRGTVTGTGYAGGVIATPGTPIDNFILEVVVGAIDDLDITEASVSGTGNHGTTISTDYWTVWSTDDGEGHNPDAYDGPGNTTLYGISFSAQDLRFGDKIIPSANISFEPVTIESLKPGTSKQVRALVNVPYGTYTGTYSGLALATNNTGTTSDTVRIYITINKYYDLDIADNQQNLIGNKMTLAGSMGENTQTGYVRLVNPNTPELNLDPDQFGNADFDSIIWTVTDLTYVPVPGTKISYVIPSTEVSITLPGFLGSGDWFDAEVFVAIPKDQFAGVYRGTVTATGYAGGVIATPGTPIDNFILEVVVGAIDDLDITEASVSGTGNHGTTISTDYWTVWSTDDGEGHNPDAYDGPGNTTLYGISFSAQDLRFGDKIIPSANISFEPVTIESLKPGTSKQVRALINVPYGTYTGTYSGLALATNNTATTSDTVRIYITINKYYDLDIADNQANLIGNKLTLAGSMGQNTQVGRVRLINPNTEVLNVDPDQFGNANFDSIVYTITDLTYVPVPGEKISYTIPLTQVTITKPGFLGSGDWFDAEVQVAIPKDQFAGVYRGTVTATGYANNVIATPGTPIDNFILEVIVGAIDDLDIQEASVSGTGNHGTTISTDYWTVWSTDDGEGHNPDAYDGPGNTTLYGISFSAQDLRFGDKIIPSANISFEPVTIESLKPGTSKQVRALINVPYGTYTGTYSGLALATNNTGTTSDTVRIIITVQPSFDLDISDNTGNLVENWMTLQVVPLPYQSADSAFFVAINPNNPDLNVDPDPFGNADLHNIIYSVDRLDHTLNPLVFIPSESVFVKINSPQSLLSGQSKDIVVSVHVPIYQYAGNYTGWVRLIDTVALVADSFQLKVIVDAVEDIDIVEPVISRAGGAGDSLVYIGTFTVINPKYPDLTDNDGPCNIDLDNLVFTATNLIYHTDNTRFIPASNVHLAVRGFAPTPINASIIDRLDLGDTALVKAFVAIPRGTRTGLYSGQIRVLDDDGTPEDNILITVNVLAYYDLDIADNEQSLNANKMRLAGSMGENTQTGYFRLINPNTPSLNVDPDVFGNADFDSVNYTISDLTYIPVPGEKISYIIPKARVSITKPGLLASGASFNAAVQVSIPLNQFAGVYRGTVTATGYAGGVIATPGTPIDNFILEVVVGPIDDLDITQGSVSAPMVPHGSYATTPRFHIWSTDSGFGRNPDPDGPGNTTLYGITFTCTELRGSAPYTNLVIPAANVTVIPAQIDSIRSGTMDSAFVRVFIPFGTYATTYSGLVTATNNTGTTSDTIRIIVTVDRYYDLDIADNSQGLIGNKMSLAAAMGDSTQVSYFQMVNPNTPELNIDPDQFGNADFTSFTLSVTNLTYVPVPGEEIQNSKFKIQNLPDISYMIPASQVNITLPAGLNSGLSYNARVRVRVPHNTFSGIYRGIVKVTGVPSAPGTPTDSFTLEVFVGPIDDLDITQGSVSAPIVPHGSYATTPRFHIWSTDSGFGRNPDPDGPGNTTLYGITFTCTELRGSAPYTNLVIPAANVTVIPAQIDSIRSGTMDSAFVRVFIPYGTYATTYSGLVTATNNTGTTSDTVRVFVTVDKYYDLDIADNEQNLNANKMSLAAAMGDSTQVSYFQMVNPNTPELNIDPDQYGNADFTSFTLSVTNLTYVPVPGEKISYTIPSSMVNITLPAGLNSGLSYNARVRVRVPHNTFSGIYRGIVKVTGVPSAPGTPTDSFTLEVFVGPIDDLDITQGSVSAPMVPHGSYATTPRFHIWSTDSGFGRNPDPDGPGNTTLYGITFTCTELRGSAPYTNLVIPAANVTVIPAQIDSIRSGTMDSAFVRVFIPFGTYATTYSGLVTATNNTGTTSDTIRIIVTVDRYYDLDIADNSQGLIGNKMSLAAAMGDSTQVSYFQMVNPNTPELNIDPDQYGNADFTSFTLSVTNLTYVPVPGEEIQNSTLNHSSGQNLPDISYMIPASQVNITLPAGLNSGLSYNARVRVRVPHNTFSGIYRGIVKVTGVPSAPGTPTDSFTLEVFVGPIDDLDITQGSVSAPMVPHGSYATTPRFHIWSTDSGFGRNPDPDGPGNTTLYGITFTCTELRGSAPYTNLVIPAANVTVIPAQIDSIRSGTMDSAFVRVFIPFGTYATTYSGLVTATNNTGTTSDTVRVFVTVDRYYDLDIADNEQNLNANKMSLAAGMGDSTQVSYFQMVNPNTPELNIDPDQYGNADFTSFTLSVTNLTYVPVPGEKISYTIPSSMVNITLPAGLNSGLSYNARVRVRVPHNTFSGIYRGIVKVTGVPSAPGTPTDSFTLEVFVGAIDDLDIDLASVSASANQGHTAVTPSFKVYSADATNNPDVYDGYGNTTLFGISFFMQDLRDISNTRVIPASNVSFVPAFIDSIASGSFKSVFVRVYVPSGTYATTYSGLATAFNATRTTSDTIRIFCSVNPSYDLDIADNLANLVSNKMTLNLIPNLSTQKEFLLINPDRPENNYDPDPFGNSDLTGIEYYVSEVLISPDGWTLPTAEVISFANNTSSLNWGQAVNVVVKANIEPTQHFATYYGWVKVYKSVSEIGRVADSFSLEVVVGPIDAFSMPDTVYLYGNAGQFTDTFFYIRNTGNKTIERIELFAMTDFYANLETRTGARIPMSYLQFTPPILVDSMKVNDTSEVIARVEIPRLTLPGWYYAKAKAMQQRGQPAKNFIIALNVLYQPNISEGIGVSDNPVTKSYVDIQCYGQEPRLTIMNMAAEIVRTATEKDMTNNLFRWYLDNNAGKAVAQGLYVIVLQTKIDNQEKVFTKKILVVK